ncbi:MAG TPA: translocation/assembly module TamB domain-containing protein, partial [Spirochaetia bacterium]|nr:translocation/assembly module TamB domain-containing protein [Spirochaetia bacterium]
NFDPRITARAEVREWDPTSGEEIRIYLDADNPLSKFSPQFSSDPPRPENYLLAMIGAPFVARAETQGLGLSAALISSDIVSQAWLLRPLENRLRDALGLDMVSVRTQIIQNLLAQKIFGTTLNPLDNTSISLGKYIGNDLFLEALVRLQTQPVPGSAGLSTYAPGGGGGVGLPPIPSATLPTAGIGLTPQLEWSMEWTTPFFTLDWIFQPQHPETLFLTDNALSFSWRFSY